MSYRWLSSAAVVLTAIYVGYYVEVVHEQSDGAVAWWYVGFLAVGVAALLVATAGRAPRVALAVAVAVLALGVLPGLLSVGPALLPAAAAAAAALVLARRRRPRPLPVG